MTTAKTIKQLYSDIDGFWTQGVAPDGSPLRRGRAHVYGELTPAGVAQLVRATRMTDSDSFVDLGSGVGKVVLQVAMLVPGIRCLGIELDSERHAGARRALRAAVKEGFVPKGACTLRHDSILDAKYGRASVLLANSTCFPSALLGQVAVRIAAMRRPVTFVTFQELPKALGTAVRGAGHAPLRDLLGSQERDVHLSPCGRLKTAAGLPPFNRCDLSSICRTAYGVPSMADAAEMLERGELIVVVDEEADRGFFLGLAALATDRSVNTSLLWGRGLTCFSVTAERAMALGLLLGGEVRDSHVGPVFLRSVEAATCEGTGISAADRAETLRAAGAPDAGMGSLKSPGHVMPVVVGLRGTAHRASAEAALALVRHLSGRDVAAWTDILDDDGELAPFAYCRALADRLGLLCLELDEALVEG